MRYVYTYFFKTKSASLASWPRMLTTRRRSTLTHIMMMSPLHMLPDKDRTILFFRSRGPNMILETKVEGIVSSSVKNGNLAKVNVWLEMITIGVEESLEVGKLPIHAILRNHIDECWSLAQSPI